MHFLLSWGSVYQDESCCRPPKIHNFFRSFNVFKGCQNMFCSSSKDCLIWLILWSVERRIKLEKIDKCSRQIGLLSFVPLPWPNVSFCVWFFERMIGCFVHFETGRSLQISYPLVVFRWASRSYSRSCQVLTCTLVPQLTETFSYLLCQSQHVPDKKSEVAENGH